MRSVIDYAELVSFNGLPQYLKNEVQGSRKEMSLKTSGMCKLAIEARVMPIFKLEHHYLLWSNLFDNKS